MRWSVPLSMPAPRQCAVPRVKVKVRAKEKAKVKVKVKEKGSHRNFTGPWMRTMIKW